MSVCKSIIDVIRRNKDTSAAFVSSLRRILALCSSSPTDVPDTEYISHTAQICFANDL